jgi:hypothetical protein
MGRLRERERERERERVNIVMSRDAAQYECMRARYR